MTRAFRRVAILGHTERPAVRRTAARLAAQLERRGHHVRFEAELAAHMRLDGAPLARLAPWCQAMISLGGDGTVLTAGRALAGRRGVLLPVNLGGLGFLAAVEARDLDRAVRASFSGRWKVATRRGVVARVRRGGRIVHRAFALNDAVVRSEASYAALHMRLTALGLDLGHLVADGLIAASASGSTAYSLSAGGPVLAPDVDALVVTPACPHSLGSRSLVLGPGSVVTVEVLGPGAALLVLDGQAPLALERHDVVELQRSQSSVRVFENPDHPFLRALHAKLGWQGSKRRSL
ncbi:MAG TPA: NAD(+)/NADH kinase [Candidatus Saccharimonadaceae bacterium]|jgi:NAD+ kinase|nr:NAD(+)/NADH kinase [Candidatus Saccharimonadaceae bacterium]